MLPPRERRHPVRTWRITNGDIKVIVGPQVEGIKVVELERTLKGDRAVAG